MQNSIEVADQNGVPMGGTLPTLPEGESPSPTFFISALQDPGSDGAPGTPLERVQVVKGWLDNDGEAQEKVFDVAGGDRSAGVDLSTCETSGEGYPTLCAVWTDPEFDMTVPAFYYVRVLEIPTPLLTAYDAKYYNVKLDPNDPGQHQERAYTSPIWYAP